MKTQEENGEDNEKEIFRLGKFYVYADARQYILRKGAPRKGKDGKMRVSKYATFHTSLEDCVQEMYDQMRKEKIMGSKTLEVVLKRLSEFQQDFRKLVRPLEELERAR